MTGAPREPANPAAPLVGVVVTAIVIALAVVAVAVFVTLSPHGDPAPGDDAAALEAPADDAAVLEAAALARAPAPAIRARAVPSPPQWIWSSPTPGWDETVFLRRAILFDAPPRRAILRFSCDNAARVLVGEDEVGSSDRWETATRIDLTPHLTGGAATITFEARNREGAAGLIAVIEIERADGRPERVVTDATWAVSRDASFAVAQPAAVVGPYGAAPWGEVPELLGSGIERHIVAPAGFAVEMVYAVPRDEGSWVSLTVDESGRLVTSDQAGGLFRLTLPADGADGDASVEPIDVPVGGAQGLLCVDGDLYAVANSDRADGPGLYRIRDTDGDDRYDAWELLRAVPGGGEHGPHAVVLGPDGMLYVVAGNHTALPDPERSRVPRRWDEDHLLPRLWDARGHAVGILAPGGWVCRTDRAGATWEVVSIGFRNPYDIAFNEAGELFTYDADMEWDMGAPWYRPTRVNHVVSGAEFGWRAGTGKWPSHYPDSLPAVVDVGPGSPTGVLFGTGAKFPVRYREALYLLDWTFGTMYAAHLAPDGATYRGTLETFITGRPLPLADAAINPVDGAMYFVVGGRGVPSAVYRVRYEGTGAGAITRTDAGADARAVRRRLERLHEDDAPATAVDVAWPQLESSDRFIRYAARVALEHQSPERWIDRALAETQTRSALAALLAVTRAGGAEHRDAVIARLQTIDWADLDRSERLEWLRVWGLAFIRLGAPDASDTRRLARPFLDVYPTGDDDLDRELCDLLVYLDAPAVVARTIPLMERVDARPVPSADPALLGRSETYGRVILEMAAATPQRQQVHYALALRNARSGWTPALRERYFRWFETARRTSGGHSFVGFLDQIRADALEQMPAAERASVERIGTSDDPLLGEVAGAPAPEGPGRQWTIDAVVALAAGGLRDRDYERGKAMYAAAACVQCHRFAGTGKIGGPDLTAVATRYTVRDLAESIVEPSRTISDQYRLTEFVLSDDRVVLGRPVERTDAAVRVLGSLLAPDLITSVPRAAIAEERPSDVSPMMPGLIDRLGPDEVRDLLAYLLAEGDPRDPMFAQ